MIRFCVLLALFVAPIWADISEEALAAVEPYLLPENHPLKADLDLLFTRSRVICDEATLRKEGFATVGRGTSGVLVLTHRKLKRYVLKVLLDDNPQACDWRNWVHRAEGARYLAPIIEKHDTRGKFKVPEKWIYQLPDCADEGVTKHFILVAENMYPVDGGLNIRRYHEHMSLHTLEVLVAIIKESGFIDCMISNMPWCMDDRIAFVDTQHWGEPDTIGWHRLRFRLRPFMQQQLDLLSQ